MENGRYASVVVVVVVVSLLNSEINCSLSLNYTQLLFAIVMDWVMRQSTISILYGLIWVDGTRLTDLDFADDVVLIDSDVKRLQELTTAVEQEASKVGLCVNSNKCHVMVSGGWKAMLTSTLLELPLRQ